MKLSELIQAAQKAMNYYGDIELITNDGWGVSSLECKPITYAESTSWDCDEGDVFARIKTFE